MSERTREIVDRLQITLPDFDAPVALMSGGQRQAVAVARAVAFSSKLVILDEPTAALGLRESGRVLDLIRRLKSDGIAVILISHSMDHVMAVADRAVVLRRGRTVGELVPTPDNLEQLVAWIVGAADGTELTTNNTIHRRRTNEIRPLLASAPGAGIDGGGMRRRRRCSVAARRDRGRDTGDRSSGHRSTGNRSAGNAGTGDGGTGHRTSRDRGVVGEATP